MKARRITCLALPFLLAAGLTLAAEEQHTVPPSPAPIASHEPSAAATGTGHEAASHGSSGEHGPAIKLFGKTLGTGAQFGAKLFNFIILVLVIYFLLKGALSAAFKARTKEIQDLLSQAERDKAEGEAQLKELEAKMAGLKGELDSVMTKAEADAEFEKQRILEAAKAEAAQILAQASADIENQRRTAEAELRALVAELAVEGATARIKARTQGEVAERILNRAIEQVGGAQ